MNQNELSNITTYNEYKNALRQELNTAAVSFVRIGYLLKQARDTDILKESEYSNIEEFAKKEFGLDKSQVSRFIGINDRFSINGNSEQLQDRYQDYGVAKLGIMLTMSDEVNESFTPEMPKSMIAEVQREVKEEQQIGGTELLLEGTNPDQDRMDSVISKCIHEYYHINPEEFKKMYLLEEWKKDDVMQLFCPMGVMASTVRLQGIGRYIISVKDYEQNVTFTNVRDNSKEECSWELLIDIIFQIVMCSEGVAGSVGMEPEQAWSYIYGEEFPMPEPEKEPEKKEATKKDYTPKKQTKTVEKKEKKNPVKVEVVPEVEAEIVDVEKTTEAAVQNEIVGQIEAVPENTTEENEKYEEVAPVQRTEGQPTSYLMKANIWVDGKLTEEQKKQILDYMDAAVKEIMEDVTDKEYEHGVVFGMEEK